MITRDFDTRKFDMNIIEIKGASFSYAEAEHPVFSGLDLEIKEGECLIIEGDNGTGKSTLFRILNGISFLNEGSYIFQGTLINKEYLKDNRKAKLFHKRIGYLFQNVDVMLFNQSVYDEVAFGPRQMGLKDEEVDERVRDLLFLFGIEELRDKAPYHLSGGQKKKVAFASILSPDPDVLVLDEPETGLDKGSKEKMICLLAELKTAGKTLIIASHDEEIKERLNGKIFKLGL